MTKIDALLQKLRQQPRTVDRHWREQLTRWLTDLGQLRDKVEGWLKPAAKEGLLSLEKRTISLEEPDVGAYDAPALDIRVVSSGRRVQLEPRALRIVGVVPVNGTRMVGAQGRVDLSLGAGRVTLLRTLKQGVTSWRMVPLAGDAVPLEEDAFLAVFDELID